jgi:hypothetical protein
MLRVQRFNAERSILRVQGFNAARLKVQCCAFKSSMLRVPASFLEVTVQCCALKGSMFRGSMLRDQDDMPLALSPLALSPLALSPLALSPLALSPCPLVSSSSRLRYPLKDSRKLFTAECDTFSCLKYSTASTFSASVAL